MSHANASLTPAWRREVVQRIETGTTQAEVAAKCICRGTRSQNGGAGGALRARRGCDRAASGTDLDRSGDREPSEATLDGFGGGDDYAGDLVRCLGAGLDRGTPRCGDHPDRLHGPVAELGHRRGGPVKPESTGVVGVWGLPRPRKRPPDLRRL